MAKKSRRARRQETQKQPKPTVVAPPVVTEDVAAPKKAAPVTPQAEAAPVNNRKSVNFAQEYFYVFYDMRSVLIISVLMFVVLVALSFAI